MDPTTMCYVIFGSLFGGACLIGNLCLYSICHEPNRVTPIITPSYIVQKARYDELIISPPEYQDIALGGMVQAIGGGSQAFPPDYEE